MELSVIEDLGIKLYGKLPPVISEIVANSWDADASTVTIDLPDEIKSDSVITISDDGHGMSYEDIQEKYLRVGRKKREFTNESVTKKNRPVMGSKGIGKLSVFGVANTVLIETTKDHLKTSFKMNVEDIKNKARTRKTYYPEIIDDHKRVHEKSGTVIKLFDLKRKSRIDINSVRKNVAKHFSIIDDDFIVTINKTQITKNDKLTDNMIQYNWDINDSISLFNTKLIVTGKIVSTFNPLDEDDRGIVLMARGKLVQAPTTFESKVGAKFSYSYISGELNVEFLDMDDDLISTNRQSIVWDSPQGEALKKWGQEKLSLISAEWSTLRKNEREQDLREDPSTKEFLSKLDPHETKFINKVIAIITSNENKNKYDMLQLLEFAKSSFSYNVFQDMINHLDESPSSIDVLELFKEWDLVEAREIYNIIHGRLQTITRFKQHIDDNSKEQPTLHKFLVKWPWILDPTWTKWQSEVRYSKLLTQHFSDNNLPKYDRRIDFISVGIGDTINVIEMKRPNYTLKNKDFDQLFDYVTFVENTLGNDPDMQYHHVSGYLLVGVINSDYAIKKRMKEIIPYRRYIRTYNDLLVRATSLHQEFADKLKIYDI